MVSYCLLVYICTKDIAWLAECRELSAAEHTQHKKATIHQLTIMLSTSKNVLFPGHNHLLTTGADNPTLWLSPELQQGW